MRFRIWVKGCGRPDDTRHAEEYTTEDRDIPATQEAIEEWGRAIVKWFNETCRPGEKHREFLGAEFVRMERKDGSDD